MDKRILVCEECKKILSLQDIAPNPRWAWGHVCRARKYRKEHRCESYVETYEKKDS